MTEEKMDQLADLLLKSSTDEIEKLLDILSEQEREQLEEKLSQMLMKVTKRETRLVEDAEPDADK